VANGARLNGGGEGGEVSHGFSGGHHPGPKGSTPR
jgi:hypothetical protein